MGDAGLGGPESPAISTREERNQKSDGEVFGYTGSKAAALDCLSSGGSANLIFRMCTTFCLAIQEARLPPKAEGRPVSQRWYIELAGNCTGQTILREFGLDMNWAHSDIRFCFPAGRRPGAKLVALIKNRKPEPGDGGDGA